MKLFLTGVFSLSVFAGTVAPTLAQGHAKNANNGAASLALLAPADEYFGPLKMSILGITNAMNNVKLRQTGAEMTEDTQNSLNQVANSIRDWEKHYPRDPWIGRALLALHKTYASFPDNKASARAKETAAWLTAKYPRTKQAKEVLRLLASAPARAVPSALAPAAAPAVTPTVAGSGVEAEYSH